MMRKINLYILKHLGIALAVSCVSFCAMIWLTQVVRYVNMLVDGGAPFYIFLQLAGLALPGFLSIILPLGTAIAVLFTYHRLAADSELLALQSAGVSRLTLIKPALWIALFISGAILLINNYISPLSHKELLRLQDVAKSDFAAAFLRPGSFNDVGNGTTVYVRDKDDDGQLRGLLIHDTRNPQHPSTVVAERGLSVEDDNGNHIIVFNGNRQELNREKNQMSELYFERYVVDLGFIREEYRSRQQKPEEMSFQQLWQARLPNDGKTRKNFFRKEFHGRLSSVFLPVSFVLLGLAFFLRGGYRRQGHTSKIAMAVGTIMGIQLTVMAITNTLTTVTATVFLLYTLVILPAVISFILLAKGQRVS